jgi:Uma2 family endonuclease
MTMLRSDAGQGTMRTTTRLVTAEELERMSDDQRFELWDGRLVPMNPVGYLHSRIVAQFGYLLQRHVRVERTGNVLIEVGVKLKSDPDTVFGPDIAFIRRDRLPRTTPQGYWKGAPDLAVEVLSPDDRPGAIRRKVDEYLLRGTPMVLVIDPQKRTATVHRAGQAATALSGDATLDLSPSVAGFTCRVSEIFE